MYSSITNFSVQRPSCLFFPLQIRNKFLNYGLHQFSPTPFLLTPNVEQLATLMTKQLLYPYGPQIHSTSSLPFSRAIQPLLPGPILLSFDLHCGSPPNPPQSPRGGKGQQCHLVKSALRPLKGGVTKPRAPVPTLGISIFLTLCAAALSLCWEGHLPPFRWFATHKTNLGK